MKKYIATAIFALLTVSAFAQKSVGPIPTKDQIRLQDMVFLTQRQNL